jgi:hypothetical protein
MILLPRSINELYKKAEAKGHKAKKLIKQLSYELTIFNCSEDGN